MTIETRADRAEQVRTERRMKPGSIAATGLQLYVPEENKDPKYAHRWVNDDGRRVEQLYQQDWDKVDDPVKPDSDGVGSVQTKTVGANGKKAVLMRKRKDWYETDQRAKQKPLDEMDEAIRRGIPKTQEADLGGGVAYTPDGHTNKL